MTCARVPCRGVGRLAVLATLLAVALASTPTEEQEDLISKGAEALTMASFVVEHFMSLFFMCYESTMPHQQFLVDDLQTFVNSPAKTTVGVVPRFTSNRKFFANLITTPQFKEMLAGDARRLRRDFIKKLKFCEDSILDQDLLRETYDHEVDQSKL